MRANFSNKNLFNIRFQLSKLRCFGVINKRNIEKTDGTNRINRNRIDKEEVNKANRDRV